MLFRVTERVSFGILGPLEVVADGRELSIRPAKQRALLATLLLNAGRTVAVAALVAAIGLAITFGVMGVINMAHGEMAMLGAYTTFVVQEVIRAHNPALFIRWVMRS